MRGRNWGSTTGNRQWPVGVWPQGPQCRNWHDSSHFPLSPKALPTLLSIDPRTQGAQAHLKSQRLDRAGSDFLRVLFSLSGSPPPPFPRLVPPVRTVREPVSPSTQCALGHGGSASPPGEGCPGQFGSHCGHPSGYCERFQTLHPQPAEPLPATAAADTRPQTNGPGGRRRPQGAQRALPGPGVTLSAPRPRPEPPTTLRNKRDLWDLSPLKIIRQIRKISP